MRNEGIELPIRAWRLELSRKQLPNKIIDEINLYSIDIISTTYLLYWFMNFDNILKSPAIILFATISCNYFEHKPEKKYSNRRILDHFQCLQIGQLFSVKKYYYSIWDNMKRASVLLHLKFSWFTLHI